MTLIKYHVDKLNYIHSMRCIASGYKLSEIENSVWTKKIKHLSPAVIHRRKFKFNIIEISWKALKWQLK